MGRKIDLIQYLPEIMRVVTDFQMTADAENPEVTAIWSALETALNDEFVQSATNSGVKRWESILKIVPKGTDSLDERKFRVLARLNEQLPYTWKMLCQQLETLCGREGYMIQLKNNEYTLIVKVALTAKSNFQEVGSLLRRITPANLVIDLILMYNQHETLAGFTHDRLSQLTQNQLRNEVIV